MGDTSVDDAGLGDTSSDRFDTALDLWNHTAGDDSLLNQKGNIRYIDMRNQVDSSFLSRKRPLISVIKIRFSAPSAAAIRAAAVSALML